MLIACPTCGRLQFDMDTVVADIERRLRALRRPDRGRRARLRGQRHRRGLARRLRDRRRQGLRRRLSARASRCARSRRPSSSTRCSRRSTSTFARRRVDVDATEAAEGAAFLARIEAEHAGELTPERLARWRPRQPASPKTSPRSKAGGSRAPRRVLGGEPPALPQARRRGGARAQCREALRDLRPVHDVPPRVDVVRAAVLVLQVVGVLPDVDAEQRRLAVA